MSARRIRYVSHTCAVALLGVATLGVAASADAKPPIRDLADAVFVAPGVVEGELAMRIANFPDGSSRTTYHIVRNDFGVEIDIDPARYPGLERGAIVRVVGKRLAGDRFHVESLKQLAPAPQPLINPTPRSPRRIAGVVFSWPNSEDPIEASEFRARVFTNETSTQSFYHENSYTMESFAGDVYGPFEIPMPSSCDYQAIAQQGQAAMTAAGVNVDDFDQFMYYFPGLGSCGWSGLASVGSPDDPAPGSWYNGSAGCVVLAQELGHNYGMGHSYMWDCPAGTIYTPDGCEHVEYGHPHDPMGRGCGHINVVQKSYMGWLQGCNILTASADGTFNLLPNEAPCNGTQALRVELGEGEVYYVEYRQPLGLFDEEAGVLLNFGDSHDGGRRGPESYVFDMDQENTDRGEIFMHAGESYDDHASRLTIEVVEEHPSHAVIRLTFAGGGSGAPTCDDGSSPITDANGHVGSLECTGTPPPPPPPNDTTPPTVAITAPADGAVFDIGASFPVTVNAADNLALASVSLSMNGTDLGVDAAAPYEWPQMNLPEGTYTFIANAADAAGNTAMSAAVNVTVTPGGGTTTSTTSTTTTSTTGTTSSTSGTTGTDTGTTSTTTGTSSDTGTSATTSTTGTTGDTGTTTVTTSGTGSDSGTGTGTTGVSTTAGTTGFSVTGTSTTYGPPTDGDDEGCGCRQTPAPASSIWLALGLLGLARRRRSVA